MSISQRTKETVADALFEAICKQAAHMAPHWAKFWRVHWTPAFYASHQFTITDHIEYAADGGCMGEGWIAIED